MVSHIEATDEEKERRNERDNERTGSEKKGPEEEREDSHEAEQRLCVGVDGGGLKYSQSQLSNHPEGCPNCHRGTHEAWNREENQREKRLEHMAHGEERAAMLSLL